MMKGFTLIELIMVLAIITVIGAIAAPNFLNTTARSRLKSDIQSARVIQNAKDLYEVETGLTLSVTSVTTALSTLKTAGYLKEVYDKPQTEKAVWVYENNFKVDITLCDEAIRSLHTKLSPQEQTYCKNE